MKYWLVSLVFLISYGVVSADTTGFADGSVWVSKTPLIEGETVLIHAALTNGLSTKLTGTLVFKDNNVAIGSVPFSLAVGEARIVSLSWKATSGNHSISASITDASNQGTTGTESVTVLVEQKPAPALQEKKTTATSSTSAVAFSDSEDIQGAIGSVSPKAEEVVDPAFSKIDSLRKSGADILTEQTKKTESKIASLSAKKAELSELDTAESKSEGRKVSIYQMLSTLLLYIYNVLLVVVSKAGLFYPLFAFLFFFTLYKIYQRMRNPNYN